MTYSFRTIVKDVSQSVALNATNIILEKQTVDNTTSQIVAREDHAVCIVADPNDASAMQAQHDLLTSQVDATIGLAALNPVQIAAILLAHKNAWTAGPAAPIRFADFVTQAVNNQPEFAAAKAKIAAAQALAAQNASRFK